MYAKNNNYVNFFTNPNATNTDKVTYGRISEGVKTGRKDESGKDIWEFETWRALFVGKAREKALALTDKARIQLTEWSARCPYNKEKKRSYPYLMIMDFEVVQNQEALGVPAPEMSESDFAVLDDEDAQLPF